MTRNYLIVGWSTTAVEGLSAPRGDVECDAVFVRFNRRLLNEQRQMFSSFKNMNALRLRMTTLLGLADSAAVECTAKANEKTYFK